MTPMDKACPKSSVPDYIHIPICIYDPWLLLASVELVSKVITGMLADPTQGGGRCSGVHGGGACEAEL